MSEKRNVPTFRVFVHHQADAMEGAVVSPDQAEVAESLPTLHHILRTHGAVLVYAGEWVYLPVHAIAQVRRGKGRFPLPWPL